MAAGNPTTNGPTAGLAELRARLSAPAERPRIDLPPGVLDPDDIRALGLPSRPDPVATPRLAQAWEAALSPMPHFLLLDRESPTPRPGETWVPKLQARMLRRFGSETGGGLSGPTLAFPGRWGTSRNWSGAVIAARDGGRFTRVVGAWKVPEAKLRNPPVPASRLHGDAYKQSVWVGFDGYRLCSRSMPQAGTTSAWDPEQAEKAAAEGKEYNGTYYLWAQWWVREQWYGEAEIDGFVVQPGDRIEVTLEVMADRKDVRFVVFNRGRDDTVPPFAVTIFWTEGVYVGTVGTAPSGEIKPLGETNLERGNAPVEGQHAVWCVERPSVMPSDAERKELKPHQVKAYALPAVSDSVFTRALAEMRLPDGTSVERDLTAARKIRMIEPVRGPDPRVLFTSSPTPVDRADPATFPKDGITVKQDERGLTSPA
jgi:hypothetical protein